MHRLLQGDVGKSEKLCLLPLALFASLCTCEFFQICIKWLTQLRFLRQSSTWRRLWRVNYFRSISGQSVLHCWDQRGFGCGVWMLCSLEPNALIPQKDCIFPRLRLVIQIEATSPFWSGQGKYCVGETYCL